MATKGLTGEEIIKRLKDSNPYPSDVFTEPTDEDWKRAWKMINDAGIVSDRVAAKWGRMVWNNAVSELRRIFEDDEN